MECHCEVIENQRNQTQTNPMNDLNKSYPLTSQASPIDRSDEQLGTYNEIETKRTHSWSRDEFSNETNEFKQMALKHMTEYPPHPTEGQRRCYYGRDNTYYYYKLRNGRWSLIGSAKTYEEQTDLVNDLRFDIDNPSKIKRYHTDHIR